MKIKLKKWAKSLKSNVSAVFVALKRKDTPLPAKIFALITVGYALSPIDLIPDFIPLLGYLDDIILLPMLVAITIKLIPKAIFEECRKAAVGMWEDGKPKRWYYAIPTILIWLFIIYLIIKGIFGNNLALQT